MAIKRYIAIKDATISNAFDSSLMSNNRATGSNMGASDVLETFSIYGQASSGSTELSRILLKFPITGTTSIKADRDADEIPASGSVRFYLRMYNCPHAFTLPRDFTLSAYAVSRSWDEGAGLDMEQYSDLDYCNWMYANETTAWSNYGGDYHTGSYTAGANLPKYNVSFTEGYEDVELDITAMVEEWLAALSDGGNQHRRKNHGVGLFFSSSMEAFSSSADDLVSDNSYTPVNDDGAKRSYYTKKFFGRSSEFFFRRPAIEARWDASQKDNGGNFYLSSSLASGDDNLNTLYMYNYVRGQLKDIPGLSNGIIFLETYKHLTGAATPLTLPVGGGVATDGQSYVTGGAVDSKTGIYSASFAFTGSDYSKIYPVWLSGSTYALTGLDPIQFFTGSAITVREFPTSDFNPSPKYASKITNLKSKYFKDENARIRLYVRQKDWNPTIYTKATSNIESEVVEDVYYKVLRAVDELDVVSYGTGSLNHTRASYDASGSYFDFDMSLLEPGYMYGFKFTYYVNGAYHEQPEIFKFRVE